MKKIKFKIATPERVVYQGEVEQLTCPTTTGEITVLPDHIPLVSNIKSGELRVKENEHVHNFFVSGGCVEILPQNEVVVLADVSEHDEEIDLERAEEARARAEKIMKEETLDAEAFAETQASLERALVRLKIGGRKKYRDVGKTIN